MFNVCLCGAAAGYPHDPCCPYPLFHGSREQQLDWQTQYQQNRYYQSCLFRSWAADQVFAEVLARHGYDAAQLPDDPPLRDHGLSAAYHEARAAAQQVLDEPLEKYQ